jgi:O-antigen/teichoic acid export membrane protein
MPNGWSQFASQHWIIGGIVASLLWFLAGRQSLSNRKPDFAVLWQSGGVLVVLVLCGWAIADHEWIGLAVAIVVLFIEVRSIKRKWATARGGQR